MLTSGNVQKQQLVYKPSKFLMSWNITVQSFMKRNFRGFCEIGKVIKFTPPTCLGYMTSKKSGNNRVNKGLSPILVLLFRGCKQIN